MLEKGRLCISCMREIEDFDICPYCGYAQSTPFLPSQLPPRTVLQDRYFVGKVIQKNGEGITYIGYDQVADTKVVIKEYFPDNLSVREKGGMKILPQPGEETKFKALMLDFIDLAKILSRSRSLTAVIPVIDIFEDNNTVYTVSTFVETITLREYLLNKGGELSWAEAKPQFAPLISALNTLHTTVSLNHLGLSPETILVDKNEQLKLSGFSIEALRTANSGIANELYPGYAAPEQYNSANWIGQWTDVYAIAAVMYKVLTGTMPPESTSRIVSESLVPAYQLNKAVPVNISNALSKAMNISPEKRTQTIEELILAFTETAEFLRPESGKQNQKPKKNKINAIWVVVIVVSALLVGLAGFFIVKWLFAPDDGPVYVSSDIVSDVSDVSEPPSEESKTGESSQGEASQSTVLAVPKFVGQKLENVQSNPDYKEKFTFTVEEVFSNTAPAGEIIEQSVKDGDLVAPLSAIKLKVSKGKETVEMPNLIGNTQGAATYKLNNLKIKYEIQEKETTAQEPGYVIETNPKEGMGVRVEKDTVTLYISKWPTGGTASSAEPAQD